MFMAPSLQTALLLLLSCLPFLASCRSIPKVEYQDLSSRNLSTTSIKIQPIQASNNSYVRAVQLSDNSLLLSYTHSDGAARTIEILRSTDDGQSFKPYGEIAHRDSNADMDNAFLLEVGHTKPPTVLAAFRNHDQNDDGDYTWFRITVCRSKDGGKSWKFASQAVEFSAESTDGLGVWEPFMRIGEGGKIEMTYSGELAADNQETFKTVSENGSTWSRPVNLKVHDESKKLRDGMQGIVKVKDQKNGTDALVMVFETTTRGESMFNVEYAVSYDGGSNYTDRDVVYMPADTKQAGSPQVVNVGDHGLAVLFMTDESTSTQDWPSVAQVKSVTSDGLKDGKIEWSTTPEIVGDGDSHWPGLLGFDGKVFGTYDRSGAIQGKFLDF
ncbi:putative Sialidase [Seiridium cardinale]|uniref:Sialidase n=1 Tax=Seiridium cardinale TaxID=138064 RepID=A0ABR2X8A3_9PEZI